MAAAGVGNSAGAIQLFDFGAPHIVPGVGRNEIISGGVFVLASGANSVVSSGTNSFSPGSVLFTRDASGNYFNGINMYATAVSGNAAVAIGGVFILQCVGSVFAGAPVMCDGNNAVSNLGSFAVPDGAENPQAAGRKIGRALTAGASGAYAVIHINP